MTRDEKDFWLFAVIFSLVVLIFVGYVLGDIHGFNEAVRGFDRAGSACHS